MASEYQIDGEALRLARRERHLTQYDLATLLRSLNIGFGFSQPQLSALENETYGKALTEWQVMVLGVALHRTITQLAKEVHDDDG